MTGDKFVALLLYVLAGYFVCRIIVLEAGEIIQVGTPRDLLSSQGKFYSMAKDAGLVL